MDPINFEGATHSLGAPEGWNHEHIKCVALPIAIVREMDKHYTYLISCWRPTAEELKALNEGQCVQLTIMGEQHPVVSIDVAFAKEIE